ncbi:MAG: ACP S-malonyltransferase [Rhizobiaceae bacterium]|nr:ACP S-malonyltransferase [Rhizobiaceae bacterium]
MTLAVVFPGQGSQSVGMGQALVEASPAAKSVFDEVDEALGEKLSAIILNGPEDTLTLTANAQPALMAVSMAAIRMLEENGFSLEQHASHVAGHSLGEYSALCAAGTFSVYDTARLLRIRGNAMQAAVPVGEGAMAAIIGLDDETVNAICTEVSGDGPCQVANDNGGGQLVISGAKSAVERAASLASEKGAKRALLLPVSAPFHSAMMTPAAEAMQEALANVSMNDPVVPLVANVLASPVTQADEIRKRLVEQVTGQVRWRESVEWMAANGVTNLMEVGSGKVLCGLARRITRDLSTSNVATPDDVSAAMEKLTS